MSSYFDKADREIRDLSDGTKTNEHDTFIEAVAAIEEKIIAEVSLVTGDREFPDDLREKMQGLIAVHAVCTRSGIAPRPETLEYVASVGSSRLIDMLHESFHDLARRGLQTRFGRLGDSPSQILVLRDEHDEEAS